MSATTLPAQPERADAPRRRFSISRWAIEHSALTRYLLLVLLVLGSAACFQLGQDEDPPFTFRAMALRVFWPGATAQQVAEQVTDKIERTLQEVPYSDKIRSDSKSDEALTIFQVKDSSPPEEMAQVWYTVRKKVGDLRATLPPDLPDGRGGGAGDDPAVAQRVLGPMAVAIMGGLIVATVPTLLALPAIYAAWFQVKPAEAAPAG